MSELIRSECSLQEYFARNPLPPLREAYVCEDKVFFLQSNERAVFSFFEDLQKQYSLDGYIYGCGSSTVWALVEAFPSGNVPRGMVLTDIDPRVICYTKLLFQLLTQHSDFESLIEALSGVNRTGWKKALEPVVDKEADIVLKNVLKEWLGTEEAAIPPSGKFQWMKTVLLDKANQINWYGANARINVLHLIRKNYPVLHELAAAGNMIIFYRDVFDSMLTKAVANLPGYQQSSSLVYFSNAIDHIVMRSDFRRDYGALSRFSNYLNQTLLSGMRRLIPQEPHKLVSVDTLRTREYFLRAQQGIPEFAPYHFLGGE